MNSADRLTDLRELFISAPESGATRLVAIVLSLGLVAIVLWLVRRRTLREEYTPIWMAVAASLLVVSLRLDILRAVTRVIGAWTPSSTIFFLGEVFLTAICLNYAVRLSRTTIQVKNLAQEIALLKTRLDEAEGRLAPRE
jgi:hypothetical protein